MNLTVKLCKHNTFMFISLKKKKDFIDGNNEHRHVPPVQRSLLPVHHQVTVPSRFGADGIPGLLFTSLTVAVVFPENTKTFTLAVREAVTQQRAIPNGFRGPIRRLLFGQLLDDNPGYGIPSCGRVAFGVVGAGAHPHGYVNQTCLHPLTHPFNWREEKRFRERRHLSPRMGRCSSIPNCYIWT